MVQLPVFQFNQSVLKPWEPVKQLCELFSGLNDWSVYDWMTSFNDDLETTPALALQKTELHDDLIDLAGLYRNESRNVHLRFSFEGLPSDNR